VAGALIRPIAVIANAAMFAATPIVGGHYFVDLLAGVAVALVAIVVARRLSREPVRKPIQTRAAGAEAFAGMAANVTPGE
jgi:membrane-associated phospholipid phosphatase